MKQETLNRAVLEARRFIRTAVGVKFDKYGPIDTKNSASAKRASMDLTRALADLRQGR